MVPSVDTSGIPKQLFILIGPDGAGTEKVILASPRPETSNARQLLLTTWNDLIPGGTHVVRAPTSVEGPRPAAGDGKYCVVCNNKAPGCQHRVVSCERGNIITKGHKEKLDLQLSEQLRLHHQ